MPMDRGAEFLRYIHRSFGIFPLWLCPIRSTETPQLLSPHCVAAGGCGTGSRAPLLLNVGIYGEPSRIPVPFPFRELHMLEMDVLRAFQGRKMLYSHNLYSEEEFWQYYDRAAYQQLRQRYGSEQAFLDVYEKTVAEEALHLFQRGLECAPGDQP